MRRVKDELLDSGRLLVVLAGQDNDLSVTFSEEILQIGLECNLGLPSDCSIAGILDFLRIALNCPFFGCNDRSVRVSRGKSRDRGGFKAGGSGRSDRGDERHVEVE